MTWVGRRVCGAVLLLATQGDVGAGMWPTRPFISEAGAAAPAAPPDGARARMVREACPTIAGDEVTYGDGAPGSPSRQEGPRGPKKRDRAAAEPGRVGGVPDGGLGAGASAGAHGSATKKRRRKHSQATTRDVRRHGQRMAEFGASRGNAPGSDPGPTEGRGISGGGLG